MAKKLLGDRHIGDKSFSKDQIISDEDFATSGLSDADVVNVSQVAAPVADKETVDAPVDADSDLDAHATDDATKQQQGQSVSAGGASDDAAKGDTSGASTVAGEGDSKTIEHTLTEQDLIDDPKLAETGKKVGDVITVEAIEIELTQADLDADATLAQAGKKAGDKILVEKSA